MKISGSLRDLLSKDPSRQIFDNISSLPKSAIDSNHSVHLTTLGNGIEGIVSNWKPFPQLANTVKNLASGYAICAEKNPYAENIYCVFLVVELKTGWCIRIPAIDVVAAYSNPWFKMTNSLPVEIAESFYIPFNGMSYASRREFMVAPYHENLPRELLGGWTDLDFYVTSNRLRRNTAAAVEKALGDLNGILIWLESQWGDLLLTNTNDMDLKVYHTYKSSLENVVELRNPVSQLDQYFCHVVRGEKSPFEFRR